MESDVSIENDMDNRTYMFGENCHRTLPDINKLQFGCNQEVTSNHHIVSESLLITNNYNFANLNNTTAEVQQTHNVCAINSRGFGNYCPSVNRMKYVDLHGDASKTSDGNTYSPSNQGEIFCNVGVERNFNKYKSDSDNDKCSELNLMEERTVYQNHVEHCHDKDNAIQCAKNDHYEPKVPENIKWADNVFRTKFDNEEGLSTVIEENVASSIAKRKVPEVSYIQSPTSELAITKCTSKREKKHKKSKCSKLSENISHCRRQVFKTAHFNEMFKGFHEFQKTGKFCDIRLCMDDGNILVHSLVIITACPYFLKRFKSLPKIYSDHEPIKSLTFSDIPYWVMEKVVTFLYTGETDIDDDLVEDFNKHCSTLGIIGLEWETISKSLVTVTEANDNKTKVKKMKHGTKKQGKKVCKDKHLQKSKKRKLSDGKCPEKKAKKPKKMKTSDKEQDINVVVKVETSTNTFEVLDKSEKHILDENNDSCYSTACDADGNSCESDAKSKDKFIDSGDDTDSYFEKDINETNTEERNDIVENIPAESINEQGVENLNGNGGACYKCGREFFFQSELIGHKNRCTGKSNRQRKKCVTCNMNFDSTEEYLSHRITDKTCLALRQKRLVIRNQKRLEMRRKFACCVCPRRFRRIADKIEHEFIAHEIKYDKEQWPDLKCEFCDYWSMNPWKLHHHKLVSCSKGQKTICDMCGNTYKNEKTLKKHKELMHTDVQPMLTCEECGKSLKGKKGLKHHIRLQHRGENLHNLLMCHICSQTYRNVNDLTFHLHKAHEQPLPEGYVIYRCNKCDYIHNNKKFYEKHMFLHEDKREWVCTVCCKAFKTKNSLSTHKIVHTSPRIPCPYDGCTYKALKNCHLKSHIENQHTQKGEKREKCHLCDYSTFFKGNLIKHQRSVHKLEVVTRHSVEMKAKYKNLKSGQIVGFEPDAQTCNTTSVSCNPREITGEEFNAVSIPQPNLAYPISSSSSDNSIIDNQTHFEKTISVAPQNIMDPLAYSVSNVPMFTRNGNFTTNMYGISPLDFSTYNTGSTMHQM